MIVARSHHPDWLSNSWLIADRPGGAAVLVDAGGPPEPVFRRIEELRLTLTHVLCTHHHPDHTAHNQLYRERFGCEVAAHAAERDLVPAVTMEAGHGKSISSGGLRIRALHIPGHTPGQLGWLVDGRRVFTGDTLFRGSVGGTRGPGHGTFEDLRRSVMEVLMTLPPGTVVHPGHMEASTIGDEWEANPFVRAWRGADPVSGKRCTALGEPATLLLRALDYDGGTKCWVRWEEGGEDVVPGSRVRDRA